MFLRYKSWTIVMVKPNPKKFVMQRTVHKFVLFPNCVSTVGSYSPFGVTNDSFESSISLTIFPA